MQRDGLENVTSSRRHRMLQVVRTRAAASRRKPLCGGPRGQCTAFLGPAKRAAHRRLLDCFTPAECANYLTNSGYASAYKDHALGGGKLLDPEPAFVVDPKPAP